MKFKKTKNDIWVKNWSGRWSVLTCCYLGKQYSKRISEYLGINLKHSVIIVKEGVSACYFSKRELDQLGNQLAQQVISDKTLISSWIKDIKKVTQSINKVMVSLEGKSLTQYEYGQFLEKFIAFGACNFAVKKVVDYLPTKLLNQYLPRLSAARLYSENVYADTEKFMVNLSKIIGRKEKMKAELVLCLTDQEFEQYLQTGKTKVSRSELERRYILSALSFSSGKKSLSTGLGAKKIETMLSQSVTSELKGLSAYPGVVRGKARIINNPFAKQVFNPGDILVTSMTRPEYLSFIKLSSAFITDAGGMLCHAAITARELHKTCIVGLELATKVLHNGDLVEVDANKGVVRKLL